VLGDCRLRYAGAMRQGVHSLFPVAGQALKERASRWVSESLENVVRYDLHS
jgi:hypothetical protein